MKHIRKLLLGGLLVVPFLVVGLIGSADGRSPDHDGRLRTRLALQQLQSDFHGATTLADYKLMHSLWTSDAVLSTPGGPIVGRTAIADFFASGPRWGKVASLAPTYKTSYEIRGNTAQLEFECILVDTGGKSPLTTPLSTIPFGGQAPGVTIVQHSTARVTAVQRGGQWLIQSFVGSAGPR